MPRCRGQEEIGEKKTKLKRKRGRTFQTSDGTSIPKKKNLRIAGGKSWGQVAPRDEQTGFQGACEVFTGHGRKKGRWGKKPVGQWTEKGGPGVEHLEGRSKKIQKKNQGGKKKKKGKGWVKRNGGKRFRSN